MKKQNENRKTISVILFVLVCALAYGKSDKEVRDSDLKHWPKGKSPQEIGIRIAEKFLEPPLPYYRESAGKIPYKTVCTWLGGLWFAEAGKDINLFNRLENNFTPLFEEKNIYSQGPRMSIIMYLGLFRLSFISVPDNKNTLIWG